MGTDLTESAERGGAIPRRTTKHPYAAIEHRVIDSPAFADLSPSACRLLLLLARQLTRDNNGQLQATYAWCRPRGIGSEHTLRAALAELISHGFLFRTRSHGANGAWARYAVTWLPIRNRNGLFLNGFKSCAWRDWQPTKKKSTPKKLLEPSSTKCSFAPELPAETAGNHPAKTAAYELVPSSSAKAAYLTRKNRVRPLGWASPIVHVGHFDRGTLRLPISQAFVVLLAAVLFSTCPNFGQVRDKASGVAFLMFSDGE